MSFDVKALFTSVPIELAINIIKKHLEEDKNLHLRTAMTVKHISCLHEFCLRNTHFTFQSRLYEQVEGAAMGSPISPIVANLFMEDLEIRETVEKVCWWYLYYLSSKITQRCLLGTYKFHRSQHPIHMWRTQRCWLHTFPWYADHTRWRGQTQNCCL